MDQKTNLSHGVKWGLIIGVVYGVLSCVRYEAALANPLWMGILTLVSYMVALGLLAYSGFNLRKKVGGFIEVKDVFKVLFLSVLIFELIYSISNFVYLKFIRPEFFDLFKARLIVLMKDTGQPKDQADQVLKSIDAGRNMNGFDLLKMYLVSISISGIFALIISLIVKKRPKTLPSKGNFS